MKSSSVTTQMKAFEQYFSVLPFSIVHKVIVTFLSVKTVYFTIVLKTKLSNLRADAEHLN